ncbi:MAG: hypothetical protein IPJ71_17285 [Bdellovibrionales bacterium]|nr:hypothetical protein [Bdellovibrionales bacterium]
MQKTCFLLFTLLTSVSFATANTEGFFNPGYLPHFPLSSVENSVFKIEIAPKMHGTAFAISNEVMVTNVHNVTQCLRDYGYVDTGYDGSRGPLNCKSLALILPDSSKAKGIKLLGSNSRHGNGGWDFAIIKLSGLNAVPISLGKSGPVAGESLFVAGFPGATYRGKEAILEKIEKFVDLFEAIFETQSKLGSIDTNKKSSEEIFQLFLKDGFTKLQPHTTWSEFLSGSLIGRSWNPLLAWQNESSATYYQNLIRHIELFKKDSFILLSMVQKGSYIAITGYPDADGSLKVSKAELHRDAEPGVKILHGDATPGSSGSLVVNEAGVAVGILFQIRGLDPDSNELCSLDAIMTDFESINFNYCPALGPTIVSSDIILKKLAEWDVELP